jgi:predicted transglutaminase-like cysteine proteinase
MLGSARIFARATVCAAVLAIVGAAADDAAAKPRARKQQLDPDPSVSTHASQADYATARFFTINQVLAKQDSQAGHVNSAPSQSTRVAGIDPATDAPGPSRRGTPNSTEPFGLFTFRAPEGLLWIKWRGVETDIRGDREILTHCRDDREHCASPAARQLLALIDKAQSRSGIARIDVVNRSINAAIRYMSDQQQYGVVDKWSAPLATLTSGYGDCEDYAIAKYVALKEAGVAAEDLRLLLVRDRAAYQDHAVLAVRNDGQWLVLDNRHVMLNETARLPQFVPLFAIDQQGVKLFAAPYTARPRHESEVEPATSGAGVTEATAAWRTTPFLM